MLECSGLKRRYTVTIWISLLAILACWLRLTGLRWGFGSMVHPDEARISYAVTNLLKAQGDPGFFAYGHLPMYLQAALFKLRDFFGLLSSDHLAETVFSGRIVGALASLGTIFLTGRIVLHLGLSLRWACLASLWMTCFPLAVQLSQYSTVDVHSALFITWSIERLLCFSRNPRWRNFFFLAATLGAALACKANAALLLVIVTLFLVPRWKEWKFWTLPLAAIAFFSIFQPYTWIHPSDFLREISEQARWVRGNSPPVFFHQYETSTPFISAIRDLFVYSVGPFAFLLSWVGLFANIRKRTTWPLAAWFLGSWFLLGTSYAKFSRYWLPVIPIFAIYTVLGLTYLRSHLRPKLFVATTTLALAHILFLGAATHTIHLQKHPFEKTFETMKQKLPRGQPVRVLYDSVWVGFPPLPGHIGATKIRSTFAHLFELDRPKDLERRVPAELARADYFITINHLSIRTAFEQISRKPFHAQVFQALAHDRIGYRLQEVVTTTPLFLSSFLRDFSLDHSIPIYDHPTLYIWKNVKGMSAPQIRNSILGTDLRAPKQTLRYYACLSEKRKNCKALLDHFVPKIESTKGLGIEQPEKLGDVLAPRVSHPIAWYLFFLLTGLAFWPFISRAFPKSLAQGYGASRTLGWIVFGYFIWILGHFPGGLANSYIVALLWFAGIGWGFHLWKKDDFWRTVAWKKIFWMEFLFFATFSLFFLFRLFVPDVYWSENPIDLGYLAGQIKGASFPPTDPGFSGTTLNYYYYGFFLFALPAKIFSIPPNIAYGLAFATVPALASGLLVTLGSSIGARRTRLWLGLTATALVLFVGNWDGLHQWIEYLLKKGTLADPLGWHLNFFRSAHEVILHTVHEFPLWSYLFVDLHAHLISGVLFLAFLFWLRFRDITILGGREIFLGAILLGSMGPTSTWDYFTLAVLTLLISIFLAWNKKDFRLLKRPLLLLGLSYLLYAPFYLVFSRKTSPVGIGLAGELQTDLSAAFLTMGIFLTMALSVKWIIWREILQRRRAWALSIPVAFVLLVAFVVWFSFGRFPFSYLLYSLIAIPFLFFHFSQKAKYPFVSAPLLVGFAFFILSMCEVLVIKDFLQGGEWKRMNTVFKFYYQAWFLLAIGSPALVIDSLKRVPWRSIRRATLFLSLMATAVGLIWTAAAVPARIFQRPFQHPDLYPIARGATFDGLGWLKTLRHNEYEIAAWLWKNAKADDVILEASWGDYRYDFNVVSAAAGIPSVLSWWSHANQRERPSGERHSLVKEVYQTLDVRVALRILRQLNVRYIYLGDRERQRYGVRGLRKFTEHPDLFEPVLSFPTATLYRLN